MNWQHIEAMMKGAGRLHRATVDGQIIITNEFAMCRYDGQFPIEDEPVYEKLVALWNKYTSHVGETVVEPGMLIPEPDAWMTGYRREIGGYFINEAYFRCFDSPDVQWSLGPVSQNVHNLMVKSGNDLLAVVMPMRTVPPWPEPITEEIPDEKVFEPHCSERNDYYLATIAIIYQQIIDLYDMIDSNEERIEALEDENASALREIKALERRRGALPRHVEPATPDAQSAGS